MKTEQDILLKAGSKFESVTGIKFSIDEHFNGPMDALIRLKWNNAEWVFDVEIKKNVNSSVIGQFKQSSEHYEHTSMLITHYASPAIADQLRKMQVNFLDTAGNAYINSPPLLINIKGNRPAEMPLSTKRMYHSSGLKIIFAFLCNPGLENGDFRTIASMADVALGSVSLTVRELRQSGYLLSMGKKGRILVKKEELLKNWVSNYHEVLRPKIIFGYYSAIDADWWKKIHMQENSLWGAEFAAGVLTKYLKPQNYSIYVEELKQEFLIKNRFHSTAEGNIEILRKFWSFSDQWTKEYIVPPLLIYADLIASQSDRNIETAKIIYEKELSKLVKQD